MKVRAQSNGNQATSGIAMPTSRQMEKIGAREGRDHFRRFSLFSQGKQDPIPARDDPRFPSAVRKAEGACLHAAARLAEERATRATQLEQQIAADEEFVGSLSGNHLPAPERTLSSWIQFGTLSLLFISEWMVNALAFAVFGGNNYQTYVVALVVAVLLPTCSAVVGAAWKQRRHEGLAMLALVVAVGLILAVALVRQAYFYDVVNSLLGLNIAPWLLTVIYVVINLAMLGGGVLASYLHAESDPEGQDARRRFEVAQQRLTANRAMQNGLRVRYRGLAEGLGPQLHTLAWAYNAGNMRSRRRARRPEQREQPIWVDGIESLAVLVPGSLLSESLAGKVRPAATGTLPISDSAAVTNDSAGTTPFDPDLSILARLASADYAHGDGSRGNGRGRGNGNDSQGRTPGEGSNGSRRTSSSSTSTGSGPIYFTDFASKESRR